MPTGIYKHKKHSKSAKEKMRIAKKNNPSPTEFQKGHQVNKKGTHNSPATEFKKGFHPATEFQKGRIVSIEERKRISKSQQGENNSNWKNGRKRTQEGYILILKPEHPYCYCNGYIPEHRLIAESQIGRYLKPGEVVHHINNIKDDNRPENLMAFISESVHQRFHNNPRNVKTEEILFNGNLIK